MRRSNKLEKLGPSITERWEDPIYPPSQHVTRPPCLTQNSLYLEVASKQAAPLHHQNTVLHWLIQWVGEEHLHIYWLLHPGLVQHLQRKKWVGSGYRMSTPICHLASASGSWTSDQVIGKDP